MEPYFNHGYHLYVDNFYSSLTLMKHLFEKGVPATGITLETRRSFPANLKNSKVVKKINGIALVIVFLKRGQMKCTPGGRKGENGVDPFIISHQNVFLQQS